MDIFYHPHMDREIESFIERIHPPRGLHRQRFLPRMHKVKVDSANKHGILLEMVQVLTDLDLIISRSYISSDGGWFMDVFHVTDQAGKKSSRTKPSCSTFSRNYVPLEEKEISRVMKMIKLRQKHMVAMGPTHSKTWPWR